MAKIFIAGSKELVRERAILREELSKVENLLDFDIRALTFEDFNTSLKGERGGRQVDYNAFIRDEADVVVFIFDSKTGSITEEEFLVAYESLKNNRRPDIFVYLRNVSSDDMMLENIKKKVFSCNKEYYVEYEDLKDLRYKFYTDMVAYFVDRKHASESEPVVIEYLANFNVGLVSIGGKIIITKDQLIFKAHSLNVGDLSDRIFNIKDISGYKKGLFTFLYISFVDGSEIKLSVWKKQEVINELEARKAALKMKKS